MYELGGDGHKRNAWKQTGREKAPASSSQREKIKTIVDEWKDLGIVTHTNSAYASPVLLVKK